MSSIRSALAATAALAMLASASGHASLIGDTITFNTYFPTDTSQTSSQTFLVGDGIECAGCLSGGFVLTDQTLDIGATYIEYSSSFETDFAGPVAIFEFLDLDWFPGPSELTGFVLTTDFAAVDESHVSFTADSIAIDIGDSGPGTFWRLDLTEGATAVPEPLSGLLLGVGLVGAGLRARERATDRV